MKPVPEASPPAEMTASKIKPGGTTDALREMWFQHT
jgi:hypothetical protein